MKMEGLHETIPCRLASTEPSLFLFFLRESAVVRCQPHARTCRFPRCVAIRSRFRILRSDHGIFSTIADPGRQCHRNPMHFTYPFMGLQALVFCDSDVHAVPLSFSFHRLHIPSRRSIFYSDPSFLTTSTTCIHVYVSCFHVVRGDVSLSTTFHGTRRVASPPRIDKTKEKKDGETTSKDCMDRGGTAASRHERTCDRSQVRSYAHQHGARGRGSARMDARHPAVQRLAPRHAVLDHA